MSDQPQVAGTARDNQMGGANAKVQAVNAFNKPPPKQHAQGNGDGRSQEELDEEEWQREKERLSQRLREKRERELREKEGQQGSGSKPPAGDPNKAPGVAPPSGGGEAPKKKKLLNGTNIEYRYPSGSVYVGGFKDGKLHGFGKYKYHPSGDRYEGEWVADMKHGQGMYQYDCGDKYTGEWRAGKKHGKGTYAFQSGDEYTGNWKEDKIHGHGVFDIARNGNRYEGAWVESYRQGYGVLKCGNGDVYMGNWTKGKEDKEGVLTYANGNIYAGDWKMGQMDGKGILVEEAQKYTVEHISGYLIAKVPVEADGAVDPDWNKANKLYMSHLERMEAERGGGGGGGAAGGGGGGADPEELTKLKLERDMWEKKYNDLLAQKGGGTTTDVADAGGEENLDFNDHAAVRARIAELKEQREMQARRADEMEQKVKQAESQLGELEFENKRLKEAAAAGGGATAVSGADQAEMDKMQRRIADLERELNARKQPAASGNRQSNDPLELKAQLELLDGEVRHLRSTREELQKQRQANLEAQTSIMQLEQKNEELLKEVNVVRQRASHSTNEANEDAKRQIDQQADEIKDLRQELQDQKVAALTNEQSLKKAKQRLRDAEEKALRVNDLESQLASLKNSKSNSNDAIEKRSNELDTLRNKNAELERRLEEMDGNAAAAGAAGAAAGAGASSAAHAAQVKELQAKVDSQHSDYKKEKKKHKKAAAERDELSGKVAALGLELERTRRAAEVADGGVTAVVRVRPAQPNETGRSMVEVPSATSVSVNGETFSGFAFCAGPEQNNNIDAVLEDLRPTARSVAQGFNGCVLTLGPMGGGKSQFCNAASKTLLGDVFKAVDEATRPGGRAQSFTPSYSITCVEVNCDGTFDLNNSGSTGSDLRPMRDTFGSVVLDGVMSVPCQLARDAAVDYMAAVGRRRRQRSHLIYTLHVTLRHKVSEAVLRGKFTIADLAGSGSLGDQEDVEAAKYVNKSMIALNNVVTALASSGQTGVPYRDDPLTTVLADALGGNCRLAVVCAVGPGENDAEAAAQAVGVAQKLTKVQSRAVAQLETSETGRLRGLVAQLQSPEAAEPVLHDIDSLRE